MAARAHSTLAELTDATRIHRDLEGRGYTAAHSVAELLGHLGLGRGTLVCATVRGQRGSDPRRLFASPIRAVAPPTSAKSCLKGTLTAEAPHSPTTDYLDLEDPSLGRYLSFLGNIGTPLVLLVQVLGLESNTHPRVRVGLAPTLLTGTRDEIVVGTGLEPGN